MKNFFSIDQIVQKSELTVRRFPISVALTVCLAFFLVVPQTNVPYRLYAFLAVGAVISAAAALWLEDRFGCWMQYIITAAITSLWGVYSFFLPIDGKTIPFSTWADVVVIAIAAFLALFFGSFMKKGDDNAFWNFTLRTIGQLGLALVFGTALFIGLAGACYAIDKLFGLPVIPWHREVAILCFYLFVPLCFLANIPDKIAKHSEEAVINKILKISTLYILVPLTVIYAVILYVYLFNIVFTWKLPKGAVSSLVSAIAFMGLSITIALYPSRPRLTRYFGLMILPLLVLMTVGIVRRLDDYGITIARGQILLINIWFYGIYAYLFLTKAKRIRWIPASFAAIALLASVGPWSITNVTKRVLLAEISRSDDHEAIRDKVRYLNNRYGSEVLAGHAILRIGPRDRESTGAVWFTTPARRWDNKITPVDNFNTFVHLRFHHAVPARPIVGGDVRDIHYFIENNLLTVMVAGHDRNFTIPLLELKDNKEMIYEGDDYIFLVTEFNGRSFQGPDSIGLSTLHGFLFYNRADPAATSTTP
jgi:hypothetical protein